MNDERRNGVQMGVASDWVGLSLRRILGFGGRVRGGKPSTNEKPRTPARAPGASVNEWTMCKWEWFRQAQPNGFGLGGLVHFDTPCGRSATPGRVVGFGGRVCGGVNGLCHGLTDGNGWTARKWESLRTGWACPCGGFWVSGGASVGEAVHEFFPRINE